MKVSIKKQIPYKLPNRKKKLLTDEFLMTLKTELDEIFINPEKQCESTYLNSYIWLASTAGFQEALKIASEKHNVIHAIYEYDNKLPWHFSDAFQDDILLLMIERKIIDMGEFADSPSMEELIDEGIIEWNYIVQEHKGYRVIVKDWNIIE